jgi:hypothetical protein
MNLYRLLQKRAAAGHPVCVGLIGAGKFGSMFLSQVPTTPGLKVAAIADLSPERARQACRNVGWTEERIAATRFVDDAAAMIGFPEVEVVVEATGHAPAGIAHARRTIREGKHIVMVNVEADVLAGPLLAREAEAAGVVYSLAYGDQPALICELVDWARSCGFPVIAAGKGTKYMSEYHASTPETVWGHYGLTPEQAQLGGMNPQMFNSFLDGTKSGIEMAAVANASGLTPAPDGLVFPPIGTHEMAELLRPGNAGTLHHSGQVEVISSVHRDGSPGGERPALGRVCRVRGAERLRATLFLRIRCRYGFLRARIGAVSSVSSDRVGTERLYPVGGVAQGSNRGAHRVPRRCGVDRQARLACRRDAGWRGRRLRLGQADDRGRQSAPRWPADRAGQSRASAARRACRPAGDLGRCTHRPG